MREIDKTAEETLIETVLRVAVPEDNLVDDPTTREAQDPAVQLASALDVADRHAEAQVRAIDGGRQLHVDIAVRIDTDLTKIVAERSTDVRVENALPLDGEHRLRVTALGGLEHVRIHNPAAGAGDAREVLDGLRRNDELREEDGPVRRGGLNEDLDSGHEATQEADRVLDDKSIALIGDGPDDDLLEVGKEAEEDTLRDDIVLVDIIAEPHPHPNAAAVRSPLQRTVRRTSSTGAPPASSAGRSARTSSRPSSARGATDNPGIGRPAVVTGRPVGKGASAAGSESRSTCPGASGTGGEESSTAGSEPPQAVARRRTARTRGRDIRLHPTKNATDATRGPQDHAGSQGATDPRATGRSE